MPDTDTAVCAYRAIEALPWLQVVERRITRKALQLLKRAPVLHERCTAPVDKVLRVQQPEL